MKKLLMTTFLALSLMAGQYARLKDGTIIILKDDGTWEKVQTLPQGQTPPPPASQSLSPQQGVTPPPPPPPPVVDPLAQEYAQKLQGTWENYDGSLRYIVKGDQVTLVEGRRKRVGKFTIKGIKPDKREFILNIGEMGRAGYFSFGGTFRRLAFSPDFTSFMDLSAPMPTELHRVK